MFSGPSSAQTGQSLWNEPARLPGPGAWSRYGLEQPWLPGLILIGLGLLLGWGLLRKGAPGWALLSAIVGFAAGAVLVAIGSLTVTPREAVVRESLALAAAVGRGDHVGVEQRLAPSLYLKLGPTGARPARAEDDRDLVVRAARLFPERASLEAFGVPRGHASAASPTSARTRLRVRSGGGMGPSLSWWHLDWRLDPDGAWRVYTIELLLLNGQSPSSSLDAEARNLVR